MKLHLAAVAVTALLSFNALAEVTEAQMAEIESDCQKYAKEDGITQDEMEDYLAQCVQDHVVNLSAGGNQPAEGEPKE